MTQSLHIKTGDLAAGDRNLVISTGSIGSCVIVTLWDPVARVGGLIHAMLPARHGDDDRTARAKYVDEGIDSLLLETIARGGKRERLQAKIIGGATMFQKISTPNSVGRRNVAAARDRLQALNLYLEKEDTGGNSGRTVTFDISSGVVDIHSAI